MRKNRLYFYGFIFGGMVLVLLALLAFTTVRNVMRDKALLMQNAHTEGYWTARYLEIGHSMLMRNHAEHMRSIVKEVKKNPTEIPT